MQYRRMGRSGLRLSLLSLGSWVTYHNQVNAKSAAEMMAAAGDAGINFFDNAEVYAGGHSETLMGEALRTLKWPPLNYVVCTKFFWGLDRDGEAVNRKDTLNRKYLMQAMDGSLKRFGLEHIDLIYCHRPDPHTPVDETVRAMSDLITQGKALYWGTSDWPAAAVHAAWEVAERHHLHKPVVEQPQYHLFHRHRVEQEYAPLYDDIGLGLTTWSPLASGLLTGKYAQGIPEGSRGALPSMAFLPELLYRWNSPGQTALDVKTGTARAATPSPGYPRHWREEMWDHRSANGDRLLQSPYAQEANADPLHWQPCNWYRPLWPGMRAFALPTYSEGLIRLNVAGRDGHGIVQPDNYREVCDELCDFLQQTRTAGSGLPMVRDIIRTRKTAFDQPTSAPPADLIVLWQEETPTDAIAHPRVGDIGPWPYFRTGGHCSRGFWMASGPGFEPGSRLPDLHACELTALFRQLLADGDTRRR